MNHILTIPWEILNYSTSLFGVPNTGIWKIICVAESCSKCKKTPQKCWHHFVGRNTPEKRHYQNLITKSVELISTRKKPLKRWVLYRKEKPKHIGKTWEFCWTMMGFITPFQDSYNTPLEHTPGNPTTQLWKDSLYSLLGQVKGCVPKMCWNNLRPLNNKMRLFPDKPWHVAPSILSAIQQNVRFEASTAWRKIWSVVVGRWLLWCVVFLDDWYKVGPKNSYTLRIQVGPKEGISPTSLFWGWDWDHQSYSREGSGFLGISKGPIIPLIELK